MEGFYLNDHCPYPCITWEEKNKTAFFPPTLCSSGSIPIVMGLEHGKECLVAYGTRATCPQGFTPFISS